MKSLSIRFLSLFLVACWVAIGSAQDRDELFQFRPSTPERQIRGAILAEKLRRPALGRGYLRELIDNQPTNATLVRLRQQFGIGTFLNMSRTELLRPESRELLQLVNDATREATEAVGILESLIADLGQSDRQTTEAALQILSFENRAVPALLAADRTTESGQICDALLKDYVRRFRYGLVRALPQADAQNKIRILSLLKDSRAEELAFDTLSDAFSQNQNVARVAATAYQNLSGQPVPVTRTQAAQLLQQRAIELLQLADQPFGGSSIKIQDRNLQDRQRGTSLPQEDVVFGAGLVRRAAQLSLMAVGLGTSKQGDALNQVASSVVDTWPFSWPEFPFELSPVDTQPTANASDLLSVAINSRNSAALFLTLLQPNVQAEIRQSPRIWNQLLHSADGRNRLLAAAIILSQQPTNTAARTILNAAANMNEMGEVVVIDSKPKDGRTTVAALRQLNYSAKAALSGQQGFDFAQQMLMNDLIVVHSNCLRWPLSMTVANLRADTRSRSVPIVIYGPERDRDRTSHLLDKYPGMMFQTEPVSELTFSDELSLSRIPARQLTPEERTAMSAFAVRQQSMK